MLLNINVVYIIMVTFFIVVINHKYNLILQLFNICGKYILNNHFNCGKNYIFNYLIPHNITNCGKISKSRPILLY